MNPTIIRRAARLAVNVCSAITAHNRTAARLPGVPAKREFWDRGGHVELDQSWHWCCLMIWAALDAVASEQGGRSMRGERDGY